MQQPFSNLKVIELASVLAGPSVGMFFAELGAEVTKVENPKVGGDVTRNWLSKGEQRKGYSAYFSSVNWGKKHLMLDYSNPEELKQVLDQLTYKQLAEDDVEEPLTDDQLQAELKI